MNINKEKEYLKRTIDAITEELHEIENSSLKSEEDYLKKRADIWDTTYEIDDLEQIGLENIAEINAESYIKMILRKNLLDRQRESPFWGKVNFTPEGLPAEDVYIGLSSITDSNDVLLVVDWRAPIANVYYNFELGNASYNAPSGEQKGIVNHKYQYKIEKGELKWIIDTTTTITDEVLMRELAKNASPIMKNIAATIQREQNEIIRLSFGKNLLVQGVAGSGKTSIALHRIAYALYNARDYIRAKDVLIISPTKAFSGYISHVLPELGEENVIQLGLESIAKAELKGITNFETRTEYLEDVYEGRLTEAEIIADIKYKASKQFVEDMDEYLSKIEKRVFKSKNFKVGMYECTKETFEKLFFKQFAAYPWLVRTRTVIEYVEIDLQKYFRRKIDSQLHCKLAESLFVMFRRYPSLDLYRYVLGKLKEDGRPIVILAESEKLPFRDVYGLIYLRFKTEGPASDYGKYKLVTIDEMQDYFPMQYAVINSIFRCPKTVLGDLNQMVDPYMNIGDLETMRSLLENHEFRKLTTSYRSSKEITEFANRLVEEKVNPIERHEEVPEIIKCESAEEEAKAIKAEIDKAYFEKEHRSVAVICRSVDSAKKLAAAMDMKEALLVDSNKTYLGGTAITTALIVKGFEFDEVIIADADDVNYSNESEKRILYVSVTRALHSVKFYYVGNLSRYLENK